MSRLDSLRIAMTLCLALSCAIGRTAEERLSTRLASCAAIADPDQRLVCYDKLASRQSADSSKVAPAAGAPAAVGPAAVGPAAVGPAAGAAAVPPASSPAVSRKEFGLNEAQLHKRQPPRDEISSIEAQITALGMSGGGRTTVRLDNGELWELSEADSFLSKGEQITIRRAALGSFLMVTPSKRTYRVRRLQ